MAKALQITAIFALLILVTARALALPDVSRAPRRAEIDQVEVSGVTALAGDDVEAVLEVRPGDPADPKAVDRSLEALKQLYRMRGFEVVDASAAMNRGILEIKVKEGAPTRIARIDFVPEGVQDKTFQQYWNRLKLIIPQRFGISTGDLYDQEKVSLGRRALQDALAVEEFVGAKVNFVRVETAEIPSDLSAEFKQKLEKQPARRWINLEIHLDLGDRVTFGFRGNTAFSNTHLSRLIEDLRLLGFGKDYLGAIRERIISEYQSVGYAHVQLKTYTFERQATKSGERSQSRHVTFEVIEGPRVRIKDVKFDGNHVFNPDELRKQFFERASSAVQAGYYVAKDIEAAAGALIEWINSKGYLAAKLVTIDYSYVAPVAGRGPKGAVDLTIFLFEGDQTLIRQVDIKGAKEISEPAIRAILAVDEGVPLNRFSFSEGLDVLKAEYRARGFLDARIVNEGGDDVIRYEQDNRMAFIHLEIDEGLQSKASRIEVEGLVKTRERVVRRRLEFEEGDVLEEALISESEKNLRRLGIFSSVSIRLSNDPEKPGYKIVRVSVQEGTPGLVGGGLGFRNDLGIRAFGQAGYDNLWSDNHSAALTLNTNRRLEGFNFLEYQAQVSYIWPWFVFRELTFRPALTYGSQQFFNFSADTTSLTLTWERKLLSRPRITASFTYGLEKIRQYKSENTIDNQDIIIGSVTPGLRLDTRDDPLAPTTGWFSSVSYEIASPTIFSRTKSELGIWPLGYTRFQIRLDRHFTFFKKIGFYLSGRTGIARNTVEPARNPANGEADPRTGSLPLIKHFTLGGVGSLRGFREQELNFLGKSIQGSLTFMNYRAQFDLPFMGALRFGPFLDAGNIQVDTYSFDNLRYGAGAGFHYLTPVGPINLDWGFNVAPKPGDRSTNEIYFSIGII